MGIFSRIGTLIKSNLNELISKAEDPQKMLNQIVLEMQNQLVEAKKQVATSIADEKRLKKQWDEQVELSKEWERKAMLAVRASDDVLAKEALSRKSEHDRMQVDSILVDQAKVGEASRQGGAGNFDLPVALGFQLADPDEGRFGAQYQVCLEQNIACPAGKASQTVAADADDENSRFEVHG